MTPDSVLKAQAQQTRHVQFPVGNVVAKGDLFLPVSATGLVLFATDASTPPAILNQIAQVFHKYNLATLLPQLTLPSGKSPDDILVQAEQLEQATRWAHQSPETAALPAGYFSIGAGAASAFIAASRQTALIKTVVARSAEINGASGFLPLVQAPVLFIAGGRDVRGVSDSRSALTLLSSASTLNVISSASHSFEEVGALEESTQLAALWFTRYLE